MRMGGASSIPFWSYLVGPRRANDMLFTGRVLSGTEAEEWGLVTRSVPVDQLDATVREMAASVAEAPLASLNPPDVRVSGLRWSRRGQIKKEMWHTPGRHAAVDGRAVPLHHQPQLPPTAQRAWPRPPSRQPGRGSCVATLGQPQGGAHGHCASTSRCSATSSSPDAKIGEPSHGRRQLDPFWSYLVGPRRATSRARRPPRVPADQLAPRREWPQRSPASANTPRTCSVGAPATPPASGCAWPRPQPTARRHARLHGRPQVPNRPRRATDY